MNVGVVRIEYFVQLNNGASLMLLFILVNILLFISNIEAFVFSVNHNRAWMECARSIIIQNHYWFLSEFLRLLQSSKINQTIHWQQIPFDHLSSILNSISSHCQQAYQYYEKSQKNKFSSLTHI